MAAPTRQLTPGYERARRFFGGATNGTVRFAQLARVASTSFLRDAISTTSEADSIMTRNARTFRFATRFLPPKYRGTTIQLYSFFRVLDDLVDEDHSMQDSPALIAREIDEWESWFRAGMSGMPPRPHIGVPLARIIQDHSIPESCFLDFIDGLRADLQPRQPANRAELERYCYQVAATVGIAMAHVLESTEPPALLAATRLGIGMQITNILRDVGGDLARGRLYLPEDLVLAHNLQARDVLDMVRTGSAPDDRLKSVTKIMIGWADDHYQAGIDGIRLLPDDVQVPILLSARLYQRILRQLERNNYDSLHFRAATTGFQKIMEAGSCLLAGDVLRTAQLDSTSHLIEPERTDREIGL